jgi:squalene-hopene/tetraprenyl-beta-curcumene cyclase
MHEVTDSLGVTPRSTTPSAQALNSAINRATAALVQQCQADGHWLFELEADATIPAEYVLLKHYLGEEDIELERKIGAYLRRIQGSHGGWPLVYGGALNVSTSVKAYFALKMIGDPPEAPHMVRAREAILAHGGAAQSNVFTRFLLALYGLIPWDSIPVMPVEIMLLPRWFPAHLSKVSYWTRTVLVPMLVLQAFKPVARNPRRVRVDELFLIAPGKLRRWPKGPHQKWPWASLFGGIDAMLKLVEPHFPKGPRKRAVEKAVAFVTERLNGEDGLGAIFPAMANTVMMFDTLGYSPDRPEVRLARRSIEKLLHIDDGEAYCQPCLSPVWDTALACHALMEVGTGEAHDCVSLGLAWLKVRQVLDVAGDWAEQRPHVRPGGWAFQYANPHYPDLDDTAVIVMAMDRARRQWASVQGLDFDEAIDRGREWIAGLQSRDGGWAAFDADNTCEYLNHIPFADHGALLDPPTADVTARCIGMLAQLGEQADTPQMAAALRYLEGSQRSDGSWFGRWGMNYIYGTWSVLIALKAAEIDSQSSIIRRAAHWLVTCQNADGGWGEDDQGYDLEYKAYEHAPSTASQTSWALLGLMAAGEIHHPAVERGILFLQKTQGADGLWPEQRFTATGFPRVFYLRYHGYSKYFPLWALARYRNLKNADARPVVYGM